MLGMDLGEIRGHEFHYFDSTDCGDAFLASKPLRKRKSLEPHSGDRHLYCRFSAFVLLF